MTNDTTVAAGVKTLNLRALLNTFLKKWVLVVIFVLVFGFGAGLYHFLRSPMYKASAYLSIDPTWFSTGASASYVLQNDDIRGEVAKKFNFNLSDLPEFMISEEKASNTVIKISIETDDPELSVAMVNYWAELCIAYTDRILAERQSEVALAQTLVDESETAVLQYLQDNNLENLSWLDLVLITGIGGLDTTVMVNGSLEMAVITMLQRAELTDLIRQKELAEWDYARVSRDFLKNNYDTTLRRSILNRAVKAEDASLLGSVLVIPAGAIAGFFIALLWILLEDWWRASEPQKEITEKPRTDA